MALVFACNSWLTTNWFRIFAFCDTPGIIIMTKLQKLHYSNPRLWSALAFIPFVLISVIVFPLSVVYEFLCECPRIFRNFWWDVKGAFRNVVGDGMNIMRQTWSIWRDAVNGNKLLKEKVKLSGRQVGHSFTNAELLKIMEEYDEDDPETAQ